MKTYTYMMFLRHPVTGEIQQGTIEIDSDGEYLDFHEVLRKLNLEHNLQYFEKGYILIGMNIVDVQPSKGAECSPDWSKAPDWANYWFVTGLKEPFAEAYWSDTVPCYKNEKGQTSSGHKLKAPLFGYKGDWRDSLRSRP